MTGAIFDVNLSYLSINFQNSGAYLIANFLNFFILTLLLYFGRVEDNKIAKNKVEPILWDTRYFTSFCMACGMGILFKDDILLSSDIII